MVGPFPAENPMQENVETTKHFKVSDQLERGAPGEFTEWVQGSSCIMVLSHSCVRP